MGRIDGWNYESESTIGEFEAVRDLLRMFAEGSIDMDMM